MIAVGRIIPGDTCTIGEDFFFFGLTPTDEAGGMCFRENRNLVYGGSGA